MKIAYVTSYDAKDVKSWSGTPYYMSQALKDVSTRLEYIGPLKVNPSLQLMFRYKQLLYKFLLDKRCIRAECYGIVFCEANSFGIPCLSTDVGGIPTIIKDEQNGKLFSKDATVAEYCRYILNLFSNYSRYKDLAQSSFHEYQSRLNWSVAVQTVKRLLLESV
jgi:glycosyltransferase involved in cell wall biosynthesis